MATASTPKPNAAPARTEPTTTPQVAATVSVADELQKLVVLRDQGVLTEEEFSQQKAKVLG